MKAMGTRLYRPDVAPADLDTAAQAPSSSPAEVPETAKPPTMKVAISNPLFEAAGKGPQKRK